jgi:hypothetical protein
LTYAHNSRIIGHGRRLVLLDARVFLNSQVLDIAAAEHDVFVDLVGGSELLFGSTSSALCSKRPDILERYC